MKVNERNRLTTISAEFYSDLSLLDNRFVQMANNQWDLRSRHTYDEVVIDTDAIMIDEMSDEDDFDDAEDEEGSNDDKY